MISEGEEAGLEGRGWDQEYFLAHACLVLGLACVLTSYLYPAVLGRHVALGRLLTFAYFAYGLLNLAVVRYGRHTGLVWRLSSHAADVILASLIIMMTGGAHSPFLPLYLFVLLSAASRWGVAGILPTVCVGIVVLLLDARAPSSWSDGMPHWVGGSGYFNAIFALLVLSAYLFGLLMEKEKKQHADGVIITRLVRKTLHESSLRANIANTLKFLREHFNADQVGLAIQEIKGEQTFLWEASRPTPAHAEEVKSWNVTGPEQEACFAMMPEAVCRLLGLRRTGGDPRLRVAAMVKREEDLQNPLRSALAQFSALEHYYDELYDMRIVSEKHAPLGGFGSLLATSFSLEKRWFGRLTVYGPRNRMDSKDNSRFLATLVQEVGPVIFNKFLVGRLRSRAQSRERMRLAQELHDGVIQSLIGVEMQIDLLRRTQESANGSGSPSEGLKRMQEILHNEVANFREEMHRVKPLEVEPSRLLDCLECTVERFRRDLGISASFVAEAQEISLQPRVCAQLVRIVQEALANVRKHSGARKVQVAFGRENGHWRLCVQDDGRGFGFAGRRSSLELESVPECPVVIKERVRSIGGELMIESVPGSGAKLEIFVPLRTNGRTANAN